MVMWVGMSVWCVIPLLCGQMVHCEPVFLLTFLYCLGRWSREMCPRYCVTIFFSLRVCSHYYLEVVIFFAGVFLAALVSWCVRVCCLGPMITCIKFRERVCYGPGGRYVVGHIFV